MTSMLTKLKKIIKNNLFYKVDVGNGVEVEKMLTNAFSDGNTDILNILILTGHLSRERIVKEMSKNDMSTKVFVWIIQNYHIYPDVFTFSLLEERYTSIIQQHNPLLVELYSRNEFGLYI